MRFIIILMVSLLMPLHLLGCIDTEKINDKLKKYSKKIKELNSKNKKLKAKLKAIKLSVKEIENINYNTHQY